jgi:hypothetical protein
MVLGRRCPRGVLQHADIAIKFGAGQTTTATDVDRTQIAGLDEGIDGGAPNPQERGGFLRSEKQ